MQKSPDIISVEEAATILGVASKTLYEALRRGEVPARRVGRRWIISRSRIERWIKEAA